MIIRIVSQLSPVSGRALRQYFIDGVNTVGVVHDEPFAISFTSSSREMIQVKLAVDGTDALTGKKANLETATRMWVVRPYGRLYLEAWPETHKGGARFVFKNAASSVALHTHGDMTAQGSISAAIFEEGHVEIKPGDEFLEYTGPNHDVPKSPIDPRALSFDGPAVGAGDYVPQNIGQAEGLIYPVFSHIVQVRYLWWDDLQAILRQQRHQAHSGHPTGFEPARLADLGSTPRPQRRTQATPPNYSRFE